MVDIQGDILFLLPIVVASISQIEIFFALFYSHGFRKLVNRIFGFSILVIGMYLCQSILQLIRISNGRWNLVTQRFFFHIVFW
jgi:hypothetical protein